MNGPKHLARYQSERQINYVRPTAALQRAIKDKKKLMLNTKFV